MTTTVKIFIEDKLWSESIYPNFDNVFTKSAIKEELANYLHEENPDDYSHKNIKIVLEPVILPRTIDISDDIEKKINQLMTTAKEENEGQIDLEDEHRNSI